MNPKTTNPNIPNMKNKYTHHAISLLAILATASSAQAWEKREIALTKCPPAVQKTLQEYRQGGTLEEIELTRIQDQAVYVAEINLPQDRDLTVIVDEAGKLIETQEELLIHEVPASIADAVKHMPGQIDEVTRYIKDDEIRFRIELDQVQGPDHHVLVTSDGKVIEESTESDD